MTTTHQHLTDALRYLDREGTMTASDIGFFAIGDPWLLDRLQRGEAVSDADASDALTYAVRIIGGIIDKLTVQRGAMSGAVAA